MVQGTSCHGATCDPQAVLMWVPANRMTGSMSARWGFLVDFKEPVYRGFEESPTNAQHGHFSSSCDPELG